MQVGLVFTEKKANDDIIFSGQPCSDSARPPRRPPDLLPQAQGQVRQRGRRGKRGGLQERGGGADDDRQPCGR